MPIIEVNNVTKEYRLGTLASLRTTALNQVKRLTGQPVEERKPFRALDDVSSSVAASSSSCSTCAATWATSNG